MELLGEVHLVDVPTRNIALRSPDPRHKLLPGKVACPFRGDFSCWWRSGLEIVAKRTDLEPLPGSMAENEKIVVKPEAKFAFISDPPARCSKGKSAVGTIHLARAKFLPQLTEIVGRAHEFPCRPRRNDGKRLGTGMIARTVEEGQTGQMAQCRSDLGRAEGKIDGPESRYWAKTARQDAGVILWIAAPCKLPP